MYAAMRVVAGTAKGRRLVTPPGRDTRPTSDRVRESIFNALFSFGAVEGTKALDLFAGSGALGIEALSRGARHCTFVESAPPALDAIRANLASTRLDGRATVVASTADAFIRSSREHFDLALCDPPYAFDGWTDLLTALPAAVVVIESDRAVEPPPGWVVSRNRSYGTTVVTFGHRAGRGT
jgi:16S rRNA (guanine966-N2)-methyltransferase